MPVTRKLVLNRERLAELTTEELRTVAAAANTGQASCNCPSYSYMCLTGPAICDTLLCP